MKFVLVNVPSLLPVDDAFSCAVISPVDITGNRGGKLLNRPVNEELILNDMKNVHMIRLSKRMK